MRRLAGVVLCGLLGCLVGCLSPPPTLSVEISPEVGHVPFEAAIVAEAPRGTFTFHLPEATIEQESGTLTVTVETLEWEATVVWTDGEYVITKSIEAFGSNARPLIYPPVINGNKELWRLVPFDRTLISFDRSIYYDGTWRVASIEVSGSEHGSFTVFHPPYEPGACHAIYRGWLQENACIVYPVYRSIETSGPPYSPTALDEGYPYLGWKNTNAYFEQFPSSSSGEEEIPEQIGEITVTLIDNFGRSTTKSFPIPVEGLDYANLPGDYYGAE